MQSPDDFLFRTVFSSPNHAESLFRDALPADVSAAIEWSTLTPAPPELDGVLPKGPHTDLLFTAQIRNSGRPVHLLLERRAAADFEAVFEVLTVVLDIWDRYHELHPGDCPPTVVAVVVHHGTKRPGTRRRVCASATTSARGPKTRARRSSRICLGSNSCSMTSVARANRTCWDDGAARDPLRMQQWRDLGASPRRTVPVRPRPRWLRSRRDRHLGPAHR